MRQQRLYILSTTALISLAVLCSQAANAQQSQEPADAPQSSSGLADIVVTAQRTSERLVQTAVAVTAIGGQDLAKQHITDVQSLTASVPNFNFGLFGGAPRIAIRGVGFSGINPGDEGRVAYYIDNVYFSRPATAASGFFDVDRIEVLRGPQGTLYGRNATGGALNVFTSNPTRELSGYYTQTIGNYGQFTEEGAISGPLSSAVSARIAGKIDNREGYGKNVLTGKDVDNAATQSVRGKIEFDPGSGLTVLLSGDYHHEHDRNFVGHYGGQDYPDIFPVTPSTLLPLTEHGAPAPDNIRDIASQTDPLNRREFWGTSLAITHEGAVTFKSITAYRHSDYRNRFTVSPGDALTFTLDERASQISQEFQLSGKSERLRWVVGFYGFREKVKGSVDFPIGTAILEAIGFTGIPSSPNGFVQGYWVGGRGKTETVAGFGQATYSITPEVELTAGVRVAWERKTIHDAAMFDVFDPYLQPNPVTTLGPPSANPIQFYTTHSGSISDTSVTPKVSIAYKPVPTLNLYATIAKGYKSGGFDLGSVSPAFKPETLWDYEAGLKAELFDRRLRLGLAAFYYDYNNLQVSLSLSNIVVTQNAASARSYGLEGELEALLADGFKITLNGSYLNAKYKHYVTQDPALPGSPVLDYGGNRLAQSPAFQGKAGAEYQFDAFDGKLSLRGDVYYTSRVYFTSFNLDPASQKAVARANAGIDYENASGAWHVGAYIRNIANKTIKSSSNVASSLWGDPLAAYLEPPRTYGVTFGVRF